MEQSYPIESKLQLVYALKNIHSAALYGKERIQPRNRITLILN